MKKTGAERSLDAEQVNLANFVVILVVALTFPLLAEIVGFVLLATIMLLVMFWWLGCRWWTSLSIAVVLVPIVYQVFMHVLRVPLPRGLLGW